MSLRASLFCLAVLPFTACFEGTVIEPVDSGGSGAVGGGDGATGGQGATAGQGGTGGAGMPCDDDIDCPDVNECAVGVCVDASCTVVDIPAGTTPATQTLGDCTRLECNGQGAIAAVPDVSDPPPDTDCASYACSADGMVEPTFHPDGAECGVGLTCNGAGVCVGCNAPDDCPSTECADATCEASQCGLAAKPMGTVVPGDPLQNCMNTVCNGTGGKVHAVDDADVPASDSKPCTTEACSNGVPQVHTPKMVGITVPPENGVACNGVCQTGLFAGECGLRLYSRVFPGAGSWTSTALTAATGWSSANAPPPSAITAADETTNGSRLVVVRQTGGTSTYYESTSGGWQTPVPLSNIPNLGSPALASLAIGDYGAAGEIGVFVTSTSPLSGYQYIVPASGAFQYQGVVSPIPNPSGDPWRCQQGTYPILWSFNEQRSPYGQNPAPRTWKYCSGMVYEENNNDFTGMSSPTTEAASPLQITGANGSPSPGSILAAYYRKSVNTLFMIAP